MEDVFWTVSQVAAELHVKERTVRDRIRRGEIQATRPWDKGKWLIPQSEVDRLTSRTGTTRLAEAAGRLAAQLYTPPPEIIFIRDFGGPGTHRARLEARSLEVLLDELGGSGGLRVTGTSVTSTLAVPEEREICWRVSTAGDLELCCPLQVEASFPHLAGSLGRTAIDRLAEWNCQGGRYLVACRQVLTQIHQDAREQTRVGIAQNLISRLPRLWPAPPQPLTTHFGDLVYQLALGCCQRGQKALPVPGLYQRRPRDPVFSDLVLGPAAIHLATAPHHLVPQWAGIHRQMIIEWSQSKKIAALVTLVGEAAKAEGALRAELGRAASDQ